MNMDRMTIGLGAATVALMLALPALGQQDASTPASSDSSMSSTTAPSDASSAAGSSARPDLAAAASSDATSEMYQGADPANALCDSQQGQAREDCLAAFTAGGGLQQVGGD